LATASRKSARTASRCSSCIRRIFPARWSSWNSADMPVTTALAIFFLIWWVVLFAVLPWGIRSQHEGGEIAPGTDPGAPVRFRLGRTLLVTTGVALVVYAGL